MILLKIIQKNILFILFLFNINIPAPTELEYLAKASYIEKFARFTQWPQNAEKNEFVIMIIGKSPIQAPLEIMAKKYNIKNRPIKIVRTFDLNEIVNCNLLFITPSEESRLDRILAAIEGLPILTVGESEEFCKKGVHLNFYNSSNGSIYFEINPDKIKSSGLRVDLYMMEYGKIIKSNK